MAETKLTAREHYMAQRESAKRWHEEARRICREGNGPTREDIEEWFMDGVCEAVDGCRVEPDGHCPHGAPSWMVILGLI